jgi:long-chain acyl-CoA synthetase
MATIVPRPATAAAAARRLQDLTGDALATPSERLAICHRDIWYDWGWVRDTAAAITDLIEDWSVGWDKPIGLLARNRPTSAAALLGLLAAGRSVRIIYAFQSSAMLSREIGRDQLGALVASDDDLTAPVQQALAAVGICGIALDEETGVGLVNHLADDALPARPGGRRTGEPVIEVLTSGTTGPPRQFALTHAMVLRNLVTLNVSYAHGTDSLGEASLMFFPLGTISGLYAFLPHALDGQPVILQEKFDLDGWLQFVARYRPRRATLPPPGIHALLKRDTPRDALAGIEFIGTGAAPVDIATLAQFEARFGIPILISYGATEFGGPVAAMSEALHRTWGVAKRGSAGQGWGEARLRIVDPGSGAECPAGQDGLLEVLAPAMGRAWIRTSDLSSRPGRRSNYPGGILDPARSDYCRSAAPSRRRGGRSGRPATPAIGRSTGCRDRPVLSRRATDRR